MRGHDVVMFSIFRPPTPSPLFLSVESSLLTFPVCLSVCLSVRPSVRLSVCLACLSVRLVCLSVSLVCLSACLCVCLSVCQFLYLVSREYLTDGRVCEASCSLLSKFVFAQRCGTLADYLPFIVSLFLSPQGECNMSLPFVVAHVCLFCASLFFFQPLRFFYPGHVKKTCACFVYMPCCMKQCV